MTCFDKNIFSLTLISAALIGCGGSNTNSQPDVEPPVVVQNSAPIIEDFSAYLVTERDSLTVIASASDSDGTIVSYSWSQTAGTNVESLTFDGQTLSFSAPAIWETEDLTFELTVTDDDEAVTLKSFNVTVEAYENITEQTFTDPGLRECVVGSVDVDLGLTAIDCQRIKIDSLNDLRQFNQLERISIVDAGLKDLDFLNAPFTKLSHVDFSNNYISDLSPLSEHDGIVSLELANNSVWDISPIASLNDLEVLDLSNNAFFETVFGDIIKSLTKLKTLKLNYLSKGMFQYTTVVVDIEALENLSNLTYLSLNGNIAENLHKLGGLEQLKHLEVSGLYYSALDGLNFLSKMNDLEHLDVSFTDGVTDLSDLSYSPKLKSLDIRDVSASDFTPLKNLTQLKSLKVSGNYLPMGVNAESFSNLAELETLVIRDGFLTNASKLSEMTNLTYLSMQYLGLTNIDFVSSLLALEYLDFTGNDISNLQSLESLTELNHLNLEGNHVTNIDSLAELTQLNYLDLSWNYITDVSVLESLKNLYDIDLDDNFNLNCEQLAALGETLTATNIKGPDHCN
ncbi:PKD domain-containing protein [Thalassotalea ganghwensis]